MQQAMKTLKRINPIRQVHYLSYGISLGAQQPMNKTNVVYIE
jgi:hypothetical protein